MTTETVTAQFLYEIAGPRYPNPDVTARFDTVDVSQVDADRVRMSGCRGEPPPADLKVCINYLGGYKNRVGFVLTGLDIAAKADLVRKAFVTRLGDLSQYDELEFRLEPHLVGLDSGDVSTSGRLDVLVKSADPDVVGRRFSTRRRSSWPRTPASTWLLRHPVRRRSRSTGQRSSPGAGCRRSSSSTASATSWRRRRSPPPLLRAR